MEAFGNYLNYEFAAFTFCIHRSEIYANISEEEKLRLVPLGNLGDNIE